MGKVGKLGRRAFIGLGLAGLPAATLAWRGRSGLPASEGTPRRVRNAPNGSSLIVPYGSAFGAGATAVLAQLHDHTTDSDGTKTPAQSVALYGSAGYGALAITDHDVICEQPAGVAVSIVGCEQSPHTGHVGGLSTAYRRDHLTDTQTIVHGIVQSGGHAILNHPKWLIGYSDEQIASLKGYLGIEIHNAACVGLLPHYQGFAVDRWDKVLTDTRPDVWGFAADDFHRIDHWRGYDVGRTIVFARSASRADVLESLVKGCFVSDVSNYGVTPGYPSLSQQGVSVTCPGAVELRFVGASGTLLAKFAGASAAYVFHGSERYVRIEAVGDYAESFAKSLDWSNRWGQAATPDPAWQVADGLLRQLIDTLDPKQAWLKRHLHGDLEIRVDCRMDWAPSTDRAASNGQHPSAGVEFHATGGGYGYSLSPDVESGTLTLQRYDEGIPVRLQSVAEFVPSPGEWYSLRLQYTHSTGRIRARGWRRGNAEPANWQIDSVDGTYTEGLVSLRATGAASFDNLYVRGFKTYYQPIPVASA